MTFLIRSYSSLHFKVEYRAFFILIFAFISLQLNSQSNINDASEITQNENFILSEDLELRRHIDAIGLFVAEKLMNCCSSLGGDAALFPIDYNLVRMNSKTGILIIPMTVRWKGALSGRKYWIEGKIIRYLNGSYKWVKKRDSGGFRSGCSSGCI